MHDFYKITSFWTNSASGGGRGVLAAFSESMPVPSLSFMIGIWEGSFHVSIKMKNLSCYFKFNMCSFIIHYSNDINLQICLTKILPIHTLKILLELFYFINLYVLFQVMFFLNCSATMSSSSATKILQTEFKKLQEQPVEGFTIDLVDDSDFFQWKVALFGPPDTLYAGGYFRVSWFIYFIKYYISCMIWNFLVSSKILIL